MNLSCVLSSFSRFNLQPKLTIVHHSSSHLFSVSSLSTHSSKAPSSSLFISAFSNYTPTHPKQPTFATTCAKSLPFLLLASLLFIAGFHTRPAAATGNGDVVEMYERILDRNPRDMDALKVVLYGKMKKGLPGVGEVVECVERLIQIEPEELEWRLLQALAYDSMGEFEKSKLLFRSILDKSPFLVRALHGLALAMYQNGEAPAAFEMLNQALKIADSENQVTARRNIKLLIAELHVLKGDMEMALKELEELVNEDPRDFRPYLYQGIIYSKMGKTKEADEQFEIYYTLVYDEFPQKRFIDSVIRDAKSEAEVSQKQNVFKLSS
ncbi:TPR-like protein [Dioscorea alata]|uniref:TPR-like protein n=1 Tax=Dioscorea alata TaxID=55571 RepID=A0ACB7W3F1_DIOAL|nr:TPR-like protein [Dioscorea alata]